MIANQCGSADCGSCPDGTSCNTVIHRCIVDPPPSGNDDLDVVTYNVQFLPFGFSEKNISRASLIGHNPALNDHDVIVFEEAFDDGPRDLLSHMLEVRYPYQTSVLDGDHGGPQVTNGGVFIVSKWPFVKFPVPPNRLRTSLDYVYEVCSGWGWRCIPGIPGECDPDCLSNKGVKYARVNKLGRVYHVFGTHTDAGNDSGDVQARRYQLLEMRSFMSHHHSMLLPLWPLPPGTVDGAEIMAGDFNIKRDGDEYANMLSKLGAAAPEAFGFPLATNHDGDWIDYALYTSSLWLQPTNSGNNVITCRDHSCPDAFKFCPDLSDHHPVVGWFEFPALSASAVGTSTGGDVTLLVQDCDVPLGLVVPQSVGPSGVVESDIQRFSWVAVPQAEKYRLEVTDTVTGTRVLDVTIAETSFTPEAFAVPGRLYRWSVKALRGSEEGPASSDQTFTYEETPIPAPVLTGPLGEIRGDYPTFSWNAVPGATLYQVRVIDDGGQTVLGGLVPPSLLVVGWKALPAGQRYSWTVSALRGTRRGPESAPLEFAITEASGLAAPQSVGPMGPIEGGVPTFSWQPVQNADSYQLSVVDTATGAQVLSQTVAGTSFVPVTALPAGHYQWTVRAMRDGVAGPQSVTMMFRCLASNRAPSVTITSCGECTVPCAMRLTAHASDPDGDELSYSWSGCASGNEPTATCTLTATGQIEATVTVRDGRGGAASAPVLITGRSSNQPPTVSISGPPSCHPTPSAPCQVTLIATASDPDGDALTYVWSGCASGSGGTAVCTINDLASHNASVQVSDGRGGTAQASVTVTGTNTPPTCVANGGQRATLYSLNWSGNIPLTISDPDDFVPTCSGVGSDASHRISIGPYFRCKTGPTEFRVRPSCANMPTVANLLVHVSDGWTTTACSMPAECLAP